MKRMVVRVLCVMVLLAALAGILSSPANAQTTTPTVPVANSQVLAKAPFDACYYGLGLNALTDDGAGGVPVEAQNCVKTVNSETLTGQPKVNQAYVGG